MVLNRNTPWHGLYPDHEDLMGRLLEERRRAREITGPSVFRGRLFYFFFVGIFWGVSFGASFT